MSSSMTLRFLARLGAAFWIIATAAASPVDPLAPRWGDGVAALDADLPGLRRAEQPVAFGGGLSASRVLASHPAFGASWRVWYQSGADGGLAQILLERRRGEVRVDAAADALDAVSLRHGPPLRMCFDVARAGGVQAEALWLRSEARVTLSWVEADLRPSAHEIARADILSALREGRVAEAQGMRREIPSPGAERRSRPRRLLLRLTDPARADLAGLCPPIPAPKPIWAFPRTP